MTAYLKKMGIVLGHASGGVGNTASVSGNASCDGGTGVGVGSGVEAGADTMVELDGNMDMGHDGLGSGSGPESGPATTVTPLTDEEFLMVTTTHRLIPMLLSDISSSQQQLSYSYP